MTIACRPPGGNMIPAAQSPLAMATPTRARSVDSKPAVARPGPAAYRDAARLSLETASARGVTAADWDDDGDCIDDDSDDTVEVCNGADDDCDGDTNDLDAFGCTTFFADSDNDTYGVSSDTACHCESTGIYTATQGGDCDDTNWNANPGQTEDCFTAFDDNCNSSTNDQNAVNCTDYYVDLDQDNYGQTFLSQCLCTGQGNYTATLPNDCNDNNPNVHPAAQEDCFTSFDDNCNQDTNELNGIAFQGVGSGTVVENIQVHANEDDGVEFFGGTVNARNDSTTSTTALNVSLYTDLSAKKCSSRCSGRIPRITSRFIKF